MTAEGEETLQLMTLNSGMALAEASGQMTEVSEAGTDDHLVAATLNGDEQAFAQLFERHKRMVAAVGGRFFHSREQIEEIIQTSFFQAFLALRQYRGGKEWSFASWLKRVTVTTCLDELRKHQRRNEQLISDLGDAESQSLFENLADDAFGQNSEGRTISRDLAVKLLAALKAEDRLAVTLLYGDEWTVAEIGEFLGWSISKVKGRAHKARQTLHRALTKLHA